MPLTSLEPRQSTGLGWALFPIALALPLLAETHVAPWTMFYQEAGVAVVLLAVAAWAALGSSAAWGVTRLSLGIAALAAVPLMQAIGGLLAYPQEGVVAAFYVAGFLLAVLTGSRLEAAAPGRLADALFASFVMVGIASVGMQLYQWLELDQLGVLVLQLPVKGRPSANIGQPNLLATLLVWGLIALWWAYETRRIGPNGSFAGAAFLLVGIAITQSRTGWLELALMFTAAVWRSGRMARPLSRAAVVALAVWFVLLVLVWPALGDALRLGPALSLADQMATGKRLAIWRLGLEAIVARPWLGWGWIQGGEAQVALAAASPALPVFTPYMHNLLLDLFVWNGIPLGALAATAFGIWFVSRWIGHETGRQRLLLLALAALLVHSMLELPHIYAVFVLPAGLMMGMIEARAGAHPVLWLPRWAAVVSIAILAVALAVLARDYRAVEKDLLALRMHAARIANLPPLGTAPRLVLMGPFGELLGVLRTPPAAGLDGDALDRMDRVARHFPSVTNLMRLARADALNGRPERASDALALLCRLTTPDHCIAATKDWRGSATVGGGASAAVESPAFVSR
jgi:O-antigen ligase